MEKFCKYLIWKPLQENIKRGGSFLYRKRQSVFTVLYRLHNHCYRDSDHSIFPHFCCQWPISRISYPVFSVKTYNNLLEESRKGYDWRNRHNCTICVCCWYECHYSRHCGFLLAKHTIHYYNFICLRLTSAMDNSWYSQIYVRPRSILHNRVSICLDANMVHPICCLYSSPSNRKYSQKWHSNQLIQGQA